MSSEIVDRVAQIHFLASYVVAVWWEQEWKYRGIDAKKALHAKCRAIVTYDRQITLLDKK